MATEIALGEACEIKRFIISQVLETGTAPHTGAKWNELRGSRLNQAVAGEPRESEE